MPNALQSLAIRRHSKHKKERRDPHREKGKSERHKKKE
jgi:hypothetical protein